MTLLVPVRTDTRPLDHSTVSVGFEPGDSDSADQFTVSLIARSGQPLRLCGFAQYGASRTCAAAVAELLRFELEDATSDHPVRVPVGQAETSLQQRLRLDGPDDDTPRRPADARSDVQQLPGELRIVIPAPRVHAIARVLSLAPSSSSSSGSCRR